MKNLAPVDPNVKIPDAVKALAAAAEQIHKDAYSTENAEAPPAEQAEKPDGELSAQSLAQPDQVSEPTAKADEPKTTQEVTRQVSEESWEHRYNSMKGRFDRAQQQLTQQAERIASLERTLAAMQSQPRSNETSSELRAERLITPEEEQDYGPDFLNVVGKKAKEELLPIVKKYEDEIAGLKQQLAGVGSYVAQDAQGRLMDTLDRTVPNWREQNVDPEFLNWLALPDPYSGAIRHEMLKAAWERHDAPRVAAFFKGFLAEEAAYRGPAGSEPPAKQAGKVSLETLAAPGRAKTAAASSAPAEKPIITSAQISKFYADVASGRYNGRDEEKLRFEKQIFEAQREGRIR